MTKIIKKNKGFVILFAVTLSSIFLALALGVANIAFRELKFSTSASGTNNAFLAADTGIECALYNDKTGIGKFPADGVGAAAISCGNTSITPTYSKVGNVGTYIFNLVGMGSALQSCAKVSVSKTSNPPFVSTIIISKGYNIGGDSSLCVSTNPDRIERELQAFYGAGTNFIAGDPNISLLLHGDGTGATFTDSAATPKTITANGNATQSTTQSKFGGKSIFLDGTGDYLTVPSSADFEFGAGDFTIDWWEYRTDGSGIKSSISRDSTTPYSPFVLGYSSAGTLGVYMHSLNGWDIANLKSLGTLSLNQWVHLAVVRSGNTFYTFKNGVQTATWTSSLALAANSNPLSVGRYSSTYDFPGYLDEIRISKGIARWTSNFTPPVMPQP